MEKMDTKKFVSGIIRYTNIILQVWIFKKRFKVQPRPKARDSYSFIEKMDTKNSFMESHIHKQVLISQIPFL